MLSLLVLSVSLSAAPSTGSGPDTEPDDAKAVLEAIDRQRKLLEAERAEIAAARDDLKRAEAALDERIAKLERTIEERTAVEKAIVAARKVLHDTRMKRLVEIASKMRPEEAAVYLDGLEEDVAASIVAGMSARKAALVLSRLPPSKATKLSRIYLRREPRADPTDTGSKSDAAPDAER